MWLLPLEVGVLTFLPDIVYPAQSGTLLMERIVQCALEQWWDVLCAQILKPVMPATWVFTSMKLINAPCAQHQVV
jgi:hypothetical protein